MERILQDSEIVELYLARDEDAIAQTARKYGVRLRGIAAQITEDARDAEECENDTYLEAWKRIPPNEPREYLFAFLGTITRHLALDTCRRRNSQKRQALFCELTDELASCLPGNEQVESGLEAEALQEAVNRFLAGCSREKVRIFVRRYWYFDGIPAIAKACECSESKVKVTLFRMRKNLRKQLEKEGYSL